MSAHSRHGPRKTVSQSNVPGVIPSTTSMISGDLHLRSVKHVSTGQLSHRSSSRGRCVDASAAVRPRRAAAPARRASATSCTRRLHEPAAAANAARDRLRQGLHPRRGRLPLRRRRATTTSTCSPASASSPSAATTRSSGRRSTTCIDAEPGRPDPVRRAAAGRPAGRATARQGPAPRPGLLRQQRHRGGRGGAEVRPLRHRAQAHRLLRPRLPRAHRPDRCRSTAPASSARASVRCCPTPRSPSATSRRSSASCARGDVAGFLIEPIQGKGVAVAPPGFLRAAQALLREHSALLIADEVQMRHRAHRRLLRLPARRRRARHRRHRQGAVRRLHPGRRDAWRRDWIFQKVYSSMDRVLVHDSTFGSNAQAMAAGLATLHVMEARATSSRTPARSATSCATRLAELVDRYELLHEVRGRGLMIGIEFGRPSSWKLRASLDGAAGGPQGTVRADRRARAVPPAPHPDPGVGRSRRGHQADSAADHRRDRGRPVRRRRSST